MNLSSPIPKTRHLLYFTALLMFLMPILVHADDPSSQITSIGQTVAELNRSLGRWTMTVADDSCEDTQCHKTTIWIDTGKNIRKIVSTVIGKPEASKDSDTSLTELYFDDDNGLIYAISHLEHLKDKTASSTHEEKSYFEKRKMLAWKTDNDWHDASDAGWLQTEIELVSEGDSALAEARDDLKAKT